MTTARPLAEAFLRAARVWPEVTTVREDDFVAFVEARVAPDALESAKLDDLYVACACAMGDRGALAAVDARVLPSLDPVLAKMRIAPDVIDDIKQSLRASVFVGDPARGQAPRITEYRGAGDLRGWLRVAATRAALKTIRAAGRAASSDDDAVLAARSAADDPELAYIKAAYRSAFKAAFHDALASLDPKERLLLKQQVVDGLSIDELAPLHGVHRATAARWLSAARDTLLERARRLFTERARISKGECDSILQLVRSNLDVSLHRKLTEAARDDSPG